MINALLTGIFNLIISLVGILLSKVDAVILEFLPDLSSALTAISNMFNLASNVMGFCVSLTGLSSETISLIVLFYTFKLTLPLLISTVKLAVKWYNALKP